MRKIIVSVAPVALKGTDLVENPTAPEKIANEVIMCSKAGASMVHLHVRDSMGAASKDTSVFTRTLDLIRKESNIIIQGSTGGVSTLSLEERCVSLKEPRVQVGSLNMGSVNFDEGVYINTLPDIRYWAKRMIEENILPELEIFEGGMVNNSFTLNKEGLILSPMVFSFSLGFKGALSSSADNLFFLKSMVPRETVWGVTNHEMEDLSILAAGVCMGASFIRVGFEDSIYYAPGKIAKTNVELVEKAVHMIKCLGYEIATPDEAKIILGVKK